MTRKSLVDVAVSEASSCVKANLLYESSTPETDMRWESDPNSQITATSNDTIKTASWLKRAEDILSQEIGTNQAENEIEAEMMVISSLVSEAPEILAISKQYTADDASSALNATIPSSRNITIDNDIERIAATRNDSGTKGDEVDDSPSYPMKLLASLSSQATPVPIIDANCTATTCPTQSTSSTTAATEDAEDFVNFLQSVVHDKK